MDLSAADRTSLYWRHPVYEIEGQGLDLEKKALGDGGRISVVTKVTKKSNTRVRIKAVLSIGSVKHEDEGRYTCEAHLTPTAESGSGREEVKFSERDVEVTVGNGRISIFGESNHDFPQGVSILNFPLKKLRTHLIIHKS